MPIVEVFVDGFIGSAALLLSSSLVGAGDVAVMVSSRVAVVCVSAMSGKPLVSSLWSAGKQRLPGGWRC